MEHFYIRYWAGPLDGGSREIWVHGDRPPLYLDEDRGRYFCTYVRHTPFETAYFYTWAQA